MVAAWRSARISACAVGSTAARGEFRPRPRTAPSSTTAAPIGTSPASPASFASSMARLIIAGSGIVVTFAPASAGDPIAGIVSAQEGRIVNGRWRTVRWLNGDQTHQGRHVRLEPNEFTIQRVKLYRYR